MSHDNVAELGLAESQAHEALPVRGTLKRARDGKHLDRTVPADYPVDAECSCGNPIRKQAWARGTWQHAQ